MSITASQLERVEKCPRSEHLPHVQSSNPYSERGTAIHDFIAAARQLGREGALAEVPAEFRDVCELIDLAKLPTMLLFEAAFAFDVVTGKVRFLGAGIDRQYGELAPTEVAGTADIVGVDGTVLYLADLKTGWKAVTKAKGNLQLGSLAMMASRFYGCQDALVEIIYVREDGSNFRDWASLDVLELDAYAERVKRVYDSVSSSESAPLHEGGHCRYCPSFGSCPAKLSLVRELVRSPYPGELAAPHLAGAAYEWLQKARQVINHIDRQVKESLDVHKELPLPSGGTLRKVLADGPEKIDPAVAHAVVPAEAATYTKASIKRACGKQAEAKLEEIRRRGGISRQPAERIEEMAK